VKSVTVFVREHSQLSEQQSHISWKSETYSTSIKIPKTVTLDISNDDKLGDSSMTDAMHIRDHSLKIGGCTLVEHQTQSEAHKPACKLDASCVISS